jgi:hypothetical protein
MPTSTATARATRSRWQVHYTHTLLRPVRSASVAFARRSIPWKYAAVAFSATVRTGGLRAWRNTRYLALRCSHGSRLAVPIRSDFLVHRACAFASDRTHSHLRQTAYIRN